MAADQHEHESHGKAYLVVFAILCVFTVLSAVSDGIRSTNVKIVVVLAIAVAKATCVALYFMHLRFERNWKYVLLAPTTILAIGLPLALLPDIGVHYYKVLVPQTTGEIPAGMDVENGDHESHE